MFPGEKSDPPGTVSGLRDRQVDKESAAAAGSLIDCAARLRREDRDPRIAFHPPQKQGDLPVGIAVMAVAYTGSLAEERVTLLEEEDRSAPFRLRLDAIQVLFGFPDELADDARKVDAKEVEREGLALHDLAGAARTREQHGDSLYPSLFRARLLLFHGRPLVCFDPAAQLCAIRGVLLRKN
jgi:hypothetical protein